MTKREAHIEALYVGAILVRRSVDQDGLQCEYDEADQFYLEKAIREIADSLHSRAVRLERKLK